MNELTTSLQQPAETIHYPAHMIGCWQLMDGRTVTVRPIRPEDGDLEQTFVRSLSLRTRYFRFFNAIRELSPAMLEKFIRVDYRRQLTLIAVVHNNDSEIQVGLAQYIAEPNADACEFAIVVHDAWQRGGLGSLLIDRLIRYAREAGFTRLEGDVLADNQGMLSLARKLGFTIRHHPDGATLLRLNKMLATETTNTLLPPSDRTRNVPCAA